MKSTIDESHKMKTITESLDQAVKKGYTENFKLAGKWLATEEKNTVYKPEDITITTFFRFEGMSDPEDNSILYLIEANDGKKGTLIDAYGAYADAKLSDFIRQVEDIQKDKSS